MMRLRPFARAAALARPRAPLIINRRCFSCVLPRRSVGLAGAAVLTGIGLPRGRSADALPPREAMEYDVVVVGGGPAGLSSESCSPP
jgi:hypothetical protein